MEATDWGSETVASSQEDRLGPADGLGQAEGLDQVGGLGDVEGLGEMEGQGESGRTKGWEMERLNEQSY